MFAFLQTWFYSIAGKKIEETVVVDCGCFAAPELTPTAFFLSFAGSTLKEVNTSFLVVAKFQKLSLILLAGDIRALSFICLHTSTNSDIFQNWKCIEQDSVCDKCL